MRSPDALVAGVEADALQWALDKLDDVNTWRELRVVQDEIAGRIARLSDRLTAAGITP